MHFIIQFTVTLDFTQTHDRSSTHVCVVMWPALQEMEYGALSSHMEIVGSCLLKVSHTKTPCLGHVKVGLLFTVYYSQHVIKYVLYSYNKWLLTMFFSQFCSHGLRLLVHIIKTIGKALHTWDITAVKVIDSGIETRLLRARAFPH